MVYKIFIYSKYKQNKAGLPISIIHEIDFKEKVLLDIERATV